MERQEIAQIGAGSMVEMTLSSIPVAKPSIARHDVQGLQEADGDGAP